MHNFRHIPPDIFFVQRFAVDNIEICVFNDHFRIYFSSLSLVRAAFRLLARAWFMRLRALRAGVFGSAISFWRVASHFEGIWINAPLKRYLDWNALASRREFSSPAMFQEVVKVVLILTMFWARWASTAGRCRGLDPQRPTRPIYRRTIESLSY